MRTILIAVDGSPSAPLVFGAGASAARAMPARVVLYRAILMPPDFRPAGMTEPDALPAYLEGEARTELASLVRAAPDVACELLVEQAVQPWRAILAAARKLNADLIVLGSHGYHGWDRILGTTAGKVANLSHRDVLIVHARSPRTPEDE